jgi:protein-S-isoprenylcysteine O-methyltransferase Ste14
MTDAPRGPDVRFPPPFLFVLSWLAAWWLNTRLEFLIGADGAGAAQEIAGTAIAVAGFGVVAWAILTFVSNRTTVIPNRPARQLVTSGPYRWSRNPMYVALTLLDVGLALFFNQAWPIVLLPLVLLVLMTFVIAREERYLRGAFGAAYDAYCDRVRRFI